MGSHACSTVACLPLALPSVALVWFVFPFLVPLDHLPIAWLSLCLLPFAFCPCPFSCIVYCPFPSSVFSVLCVPSPCSTRLYFVLVCVIVFVLKLCSWLTLVLVVLLSILVYFFPTLYVLVFVQDVPVLVSPSSCLLFFLSLISPLGCRHSIYLCCVRVVALYVCLLIDVAETREN